MRECVYRCPKYRHSIGIMGNEKVICMLYLGSGLLLSRTYSLQSIAQIPREKHTMLLYFVLRRFLSACACQGQVLGVATKLSGYHLRGARKLSIRAKKLVKIDTNRRNLPSRSPHQSNKRGEHDGVDACSVRMVTHNLCGSTAT